MSAYGQLIRYMLPQWRRLALIGGATILTSAAAAFQPWPLKILIDYALGDAASPAALDTTLAAVGLTASAGVMVVLAALASLALFCVNTLLSIVITWQWAVAGQRMIRSLATDVFARLQRASLMFHQNNPVGDLLNRITDDTWAVYKVANEALIGPAQRIATLAAIGAVAWQMHPRLAALTLVTAPLMAGTAYLFGTPLKRRANLGRQARSRILSFVQQTVSSMPVVQAFSTEQRNREHYGVLADDAVTLSQKTTLLTSSYGFVTGLISAGGTAVIIYAGGMEVLAGTLSVGSFIVFIAYIRTMQANASALFLLYGKLKPVEASIDRVIEVLNAEPEVPEHPDPRPAPRAGAPCAIELRNVSFGYTRDRPVLHGVSILAEPGERIALVGATGSGKSTIVSLIIRFFDPWAGAVTLDGTDVRTLQLAELRERIAVVMQEPFLFPGTIADNIACGRPQASRAEIEAAADIANATGFIERLPQGFETPLGERGATLSGGERQRLSIARAALKDAPVLLLDEPTSALDAESEVQVMFALERLMTSRTTIVVAHRLSTVRHARTIYVLDKGRVAESGSHAELVARDGAYRLLHDLQVSPGGSAT